MNLRVLAHLTPATIAELHDPSKGLDFLYRDKNQPWFESGYVDLGFARSHPITESIREGTDGYAVWADDQGLLHTFADFASADRARSGATMKLAIEYEIPPDEPDEDEPDAHEPAAAPAGRSGGASRARAAAPLP